MSSFTVGSGAVRSSSFTGDQFTDNLIAVFIGQNSSGTRNFASTPSILPTLMRFSLGVAYNDILNRLRYPWLRLKASLSRPVA
ncbi:hypothetical protein [Bradyrhizobium sp. BWC-3-1]|uniref:hypothetical protein n=1 Tax=unclassified Bradyrhizobium TaxID=2631580 RepID=UPI00293E55C6|nr:hypothetical protein [Bradyrhizobium sp. BWC-3-1]WOH57858.1 hypothetical protein RX329_37990 [Bradyrhizobium sp. BWC-3-1]